MQEIPQNQTAQPTSQPVAQQLAPLPRQYSGWLVSPSFIKRALAVVGYSIIGQLLVALVVIIILVLLGVSLSTVTSV